MKLICLDLSLLFSKLLVNKPKIAEYCMIETKLGGKVCRIINCLIN